MWPFFYSIFFSFVLYLAFNSSFEQCFFKKKESDLSTLCFDIGKMAPAIASAVILLIFVNKNVSHIFFLLL